MSMYYRVCSCRGGSLFKGWVLSSVWHGTEGRVIDCSGAVAVLLIRVSLLPYGIPICIPQFSR